MTSLIKRMDDRLYPGAGKNWDDDLFRERVLANLHGKADVLDVGAGAGIVPQMNFKGHARSVAGVDPDPRVVDNPFLDEGRVGVGEEIPYADASFDVVLADNVLEHLDDPDRVFGEAARVLRPGGRFMAKTPNRSHYMPLIARITPHRFHRWVNRLRGRESEDTFPTRYRANTPADIARLARRAGLEVETIELVEGRPEYLRLTAPTYVVGWMYERLVNRFSALARFRVLLVISLFKPLEDTPRIDAPADVHVTASARRELTREAVTQV